MMGRPVIIVCGNEQISTHSLRVRLFRTGTTDSDNFISAERLTFVSILANQSSYRKIYLCIKETEMTKA